MVSKPKERSSLVLSGTNLPRELEISRQSSGVNLPAARRCFLIRNNLRHRQKQAPSQEPLKTGQCELKDQTLSSAANRGGTRKAKTTVITRPNSSKNITPIPLEEQQFEGVSSERVVSRERQKRDKLKTIYEKKWRVLRHAYQSRSEFINF